MLNGTPHGRTEKEALLAQRLGLPDNVRLSCQLTTDEPLQVRRLLMDDVDRKYMNQANATEKELAILFSDIRSFTTFSERHLPHDIVHILNRYFWRWVLLFTIIKGVSISIWAMV